MNPHRKRELSQDEKKNLKIPLKSKAFAFYLDKVIEERCDEFEYSLEDSGFEIVDREYNRVATSIYNFIIIAFIP